MPERNPDGTFAKGNSGGPGRKQKRLRIEPLLEAIGDEKVMLGDREITKLEAVLRGVYKYALEGNSWAVQFIAERTEGKIPQKQSVEIMNEPIKLFERKAEPVDSST